MSSRDSKIGQSAAKLVAGLKRSQWLPHFDRSTLRDTVAEMGELFKHLHHNLDMNRIETEAGNVSEARTTTITFLDTSLRRIRQCVLAYLNYRLERLQEMCWSHIGTTEELPDSIKDRLDQEEIKFARHYNDVLHQYMADLNGPNTEDYFLDLTTDYLPPTSVDVEIELTDKVDERPIGSRFYARRTLVEPLILGGKAKHINGDSRQGYQRI